jgi:WS/DGAT/MGAT family acyltransferase
MFWLTESQANPKHVAALQILDIPEHAPLDYVDQLFAELQTFSTAVSPFDCRVRNFLGYPFKLVALKKMDMNYHVQLHELTDISRKPALHTFIETLHETMLVRDKPLWQYHLIKDKTNNQFAIYVKVHHMYGDGASLIRMFQKGYSELQNIDNFVPVWASPLRRTRRDKPKVIKRTIVGTWGFVIASRDLIWIMFRLLLKLLKINNDYMPVPFTGTKSVLTGQVKQGRVVSTLELDFSRVTILSKRFGASANEVMLCIFDIGVHRFLKDYGHTCKKPLFANMPINLRKPGETTPGNKIAIVPVQLASSVKDPYFSLRQIIENHRIIKKAAKASHPGAFSSYTLLIQSVSTLFEVLKVSNLVRPIGNILVSNMPGPPHSLYFKDAKLVSNYPISTITPGGGVNVTMITYNGSAQIGLVCCSSKINSLEPMAKYFHEAFNMLERSADGLSVSIGDGK